MRPCSIAGCGKPAISRGWCEMHYTRWRRHGGTDAPLDLATRFWLCVDRGDPDECWLWTGTIASNGYGRLGDRWAHRVAYELLIGPIPDGLTIDHLCCVKPCVNPRHMEPVTRAENSRRAGLNGWAAVNAAKTHCPQGHPLTPENVYLINHDRSRRCRTCDCERARARRDAARGRPLSPEQRARRIAAAHRGWIVRRAA